MADEPQTEPAPERRRPSRRAITLLSIPLVALVIMSYVGDALAPTLVDTHPAWLLALTSRTRNLALVTNDLDPWTYYSIGLARLLVSDPLFFLLGYWYGDAAVQWMERRTKTWGDLLRQIERFFGKAAYPLIFTAPNNYICLFAGAAGMPLRAFFAVNIAGTIFRLWIVRRFGEVFEAPIDDLVGWIGDNRLVLLAVTVTLVLVSIALEARRGETEVTSLAHLDDELEELDHEADRDGSGDSDGTGDGEGRQPADQPADAEPD
jgi:membrane protein DedA with SNARE-associated domain